MYIKGYLNIIVDENKYLGLIARVFFMNKEIIMKVVKEYFSDMLWNYFGFLPNLNYDNKDYSIYFNQIDRVEIPSDYKDEDPIEIDCITSLSIDFYNHKFSLSIHFGDYDKWDIEVESERITDFLNKLIDDVMNDEIPWPYMRDLILKEEETIELIRTLKQDKDDLEEDMEMI